MVTASCSTAAMAWVMKEISPMKMLDPMLKMMAMPIPAMKISGMAKESMKMPRTIMARMTATAT